ncbi:MAG: 30S ribosomal protein S4e [Candidatus Bathyarchaeota archaeon]|nr:MAG: 30S ribosomal protein S4e [Candidatus Bathyarchaeota archaeon]
MGKKGGKKHLKRKPAPKFWPIHRKEFVWAVRPKPGPHPTLRCIPLALIVRDILGLAKTRKEAKTIISQGKIKVNGKSQLEEHFPTGLMDIISIPEMKKTYRILPSEKGLILHSIGPEEALFKLCRIENKNVIKGGRMQLNLHDGRNIQVQVQDPRKPEEDVYHTLDVLKTSIPSQEITAHLKLSEDIHAIIVGGKNVGKYGKIATVEKRPGQKRRDSLVTIEGKNGNRFQTTLNFIFITGDTQPWISLPEDN